MNQKINLCRLTKLNGMAREYFMATVRRMDFEFRCPLKPGWYRFKEGEYGKNKTFISMLPSWVQTENFRFTMELRVQNDFLFSLTDIRSMKNLF